MKKYFLATLLGTFIAGGAFAQSSEYSKTTEYTETITPSPQATSNNELRETEETETVVLAKKKEPKAKVDDSDKLFKQLSFIPLPVLASSPANGFMYGVAPSLSWLFGDEATTSRSSLVSTVLYTTKKQFLFTAKGTAFSNNDSWNFLGDWRYFVTSQPTFGLGTGPNSSKLAYKDFEGSPVLNMPEFNDASFIDGLSGGQFMEFNYLRLHQTALKRISDTRFFAGIGYHLDYHSKINDQALDLEGDTITITSRYSYARSKGFDIDKTITSGISINGIYDSRDNPINPYSGRYAYINFRVNPKFLGSSKNSSTLWVEYRDYFNLSKKRPRHMIALWTYGNFVTSGDVPYLDLPAVGWDQFGRSGRGFAQGRFRGEDLYYAEVEYRLPLQKNKEVLGAVFYANITTASSRTNNINLFEYVEPSAGAGLRIMLDKRARTNLTLDYAIGKYGSKGFYLSVNEAF
ncbi:MAG: BamA/TamA family outer membrane protein [Bacteroidales bacterium]